MERHSLAIRFFQLFLIALVGLLSPQVFGQASSPDATSDPEPQYKKGIDIDIKGGNRRVMIPLAVPDTLEPDGSTKGVATSVQELLRRNLELSGFFKLLPADSFFFDPSKEGMTATQINFQNWFNVGAQGLIKSSAKIRGEEVVLDLRLFVVDKGEPVRLKFTARPVARDKINTQVHEFVNAVIEYYTGEAGIFGSRIAYVAQRKGGLKQVYVMDMDGSNAARISKHNAINILPSWGKGNTIYYTSYADNNPDLWRYSGGKVTKLSSRRGQNSGAAHCKGKLALTLSMGGENADVYLIDAESGSIIKRLTDHWAIDTSPSWSPDCSKIAFVSGRSGGPQIYVMSADGSNQRRLTFQGSYNTSPTWSPKGDKIAFTARDERSRFDIFVVDLEGVIQRLTQDQGNNQDPTFSPDGRYIAFTSSRGGKGDRIWMMTADGEVQKLVTTRGAGYTAPAWELP